MKKTLFLIIFTLFSLGNIQALHAVYEDIPDDPNVVEYMPEFPGGMEKLMTFIQENMRYPKIAIKKGIEGRVICQFTVTKDGSIENVFVVRGLYKSLDKEAVRIIKKMPKWKPGEDFNGQAIDCKYTIPVYFKLNKETANP